MRGQPDLFGGLSPRPESTYRSAAYQPRSETSRAAARLVRPKVGTQRAYVLAYIESTGRTGSTMHEAAGALRLPLSSMCARFSELSERGLIRRTDVVRETEYGKLAGVYVALTEDRLAGSGRGH